MEKRTIVDQIECTASGIIQIRMKKQIIDGDAVAAEQYHRTVLEPGSDLDAQVAAVNAHLKQMGYPNIEAEGVERVRRIAEVEHTAKVVQDYRDMLAVKAGIDRALAG
jgi:hypothetical protein